MRIAGIKKYCVENGKGLRHAVFVSGCPFRCPGCHNSEAWDYEYGDEFTDEKKEEFLGSFTPGMSGMTLLGGEPLCPENIGATAELAREFKEKHPEMDIWCYTGYLYEDVKDENIMEYIDVLVDGPFVQEKYDFNLRFRGSSNQRIIDVRKTREDGEIRLLSL